MEQSVHKELEMIYLMSKMLWKFSQKFNVSIEYLLNGKAEQNNTYPPSIKKIADKLNKGFKTKPFIHRKYC